MHANHLQTMPSVDHVPVSADLIVLRDPTSLRAADLRRIAQTLAIRWFNGPAPHHALSVISADRNEGRSTVAANLACLFATAGVATMLIDADVQNPSQHERFGLRPGGGGRGAGQRLPALGDLCVVPAHELQDLDSDHFMHNAVGQLIEQRRAEFGAIFIDTPAAAESNDYQVAALASGGALVVTREGFTHVRRTTRMLNSCDDAGIAIVGGVMLQA